MSDEKEELHQSDTRRKKKKPVSFSWSNYAKPTPGNLKMIMEFWKGLFVLITANSIINNDEKWVSITILVVGYVIDRLVKFFAYVEEQQRLNESDADGEE